MVYTNGKLSVPVYGEDTTNYIDADYVDEGTDLTDNIGKFTTIDLTGFVIGALALVSNKLKDNTDINVVDFVINQVAEAMAEKLEGEFVQRHFRQDHRHSVRSQRSDRRGGHCGHL